MDTAQIIILAATSIVSILLVYVSFTLRSFAVGVRDLKDALRLLTVSLKDVSERVVGLEADVRNLTKALADETRLREHLLDRVRV